MGNKRIGSIRQNEIISTYLLLNTIQAYGHKWPSIWDSQMVQMVLRAKRVKGTNGIFGHNDYIHDTGKLKKSKTNYINGHVNLMYKVPNWLYTSGLIPICTHMLRMFATFSVCIYTSTWIDAYILRVKKNQCGSVCYGQ